MTSRLHISSALLWCLLLSTLVACTPDQDEPEDGQQAIEDTPVATAVTVLTTDSADWVVQLIKEHLTYAEAVQVVLPSPYHIPTREEAATLRGLTYPHDERFITSDGYTFGMPSSSVTKAGQKTKYSVLGLDIRRNVIDVRFAPCSCR